MKSILFALSLCATLASCSSPVPNENDNILLADKVSIDYVVEFDLPNQPNEWMDGLNKELLFNICFDQVFNENVPVYNPNYGRFIVNDETFSPEEVLKSMEWKEEVGDLDELKGMLFNETWSLSADFKAFEKEVNFWAPLRIWTPSTNPGETFKKILFFAKPSASKKGKLVAEDVFTKHTVFNNFDAFPESTGLDGYKFINKVLSEIENGNLTAYDPIYMIDKSLNPFSIGDIFDAVGGVQKSSKDMLGINSLIFEENWYFDGATMSLQKEVISVGFVGNYWDKGQKILFFIKF